MIKKLGFVLVAVLMILVTAYSALAVAHVPGNIGKDASQCYASAEYGGGTYPCENAYDELYYPDFNNMWVSTDGDKPEFISLELASDVNISNVTVVQGDNGYTCTELNITVSMDSSDGIDGTWLEVGSGSLSNTAMTNFTATGTPLGEASWVRVNCSDYFPTGGSGIGINEILVFESFAIPTLTTVYNNASHLTVAGDTVNWTSELNVTEGELDTCWFTTNDTGSWVNETITTSCTSPFVFTGNLTVTAGAGENVCGYFGAISNFGAAATSPYSCFDVSDGLFDVNVSAFARNDSLIDVFNATVINASHVISKVASAGSVVFDLAAGDYDIVVNSTAEGYSIFERTISDFVNYSVTIPNMSIVEGPSSALQTQLVSFSLSVGVEDDKQFEDLWLVYDGDNYSVVRTARPNEVWYNYSMEVPSISGVSDKLYYFWNYTILGGQTKSTENYSVTVYTVSFTNCQTPIPGNTTLNFSIYNEDVPNQNLSGDLEVEFILWNSSFESRINHSFSIDGEYSFFFCINPNNATLYTNAYFKYTDDNGFTHRYYLVNYTLTNVTTHISAYNFNDTTGLSDLKATLRYASTYQFYPGVYTQLQRRYVGDGVWRTVQMDRSGDFGLVFFNIKEENTDYRLIFTDNARNILRQTESSKFLCTDGLCEITVLLNPYVSVLSDADPYIVSSYDNLTGILTVDWIDTTGATNTVRVRATKDTISETIEICDNTVTASSGSVTCNASSYVPGMMFVQVFVTDAQGVETEYSDWISLGGASLATHIGNLEGAVWSALFVVTVVGFGLWSPAAGVISLTLALIGIAVIGMFSVLTITLVILGAVISIIIGVLVRR